MLHVYFLFGSVKSVREYLLIQRRDINGLHVTPRLGRAGNDAGRSQQFHRTPDTDGVRRHTARYVVIMITQQQKRTVREKRVFPDYVFRAGSHFASATEERRLVIERLIRAADNQG